MPSVNISMLESARDDGLIPRRLTARQMLYLNSSVKVANQIYWLIAAEPGIEMEQIEARTGLHINTIRFYVRWLIKKELVFGEKVAITPKYQLFTSKRHLVGRARK